MKFSIKNFFSKCDQIRRFLRIWSHLLKKSSMEKFIFCAVINVNLGMSPHDYLNKINMQQDRENVRMSVIVSFKSINLPKQSTEDYRLLLTSNIELHEIVT